MIQQLLLTLFFIKSNPNQTPKLIPKLSPFLVEKVACEFFIAALHHYSCFSSVTLPYFIDFTQRALELCKVRSKLSSKHSKARRTYFLITSHYIASYLQSEATMMPIAVHSQQVLSICMLTQQRSLAVAQVVLSFLLFMLIYAFGV